MPEGSEQVPVIDSGEDIPKRLWFGGILEGRRSGPDLDALLEDVTRCINALRLGHAELELDGGRFSLLMDDEVLSGDRAPKEARDRFLAELQRIVDATADQVGLESTLRCTEIYEDHAVETLFAPHDGQIRGFSRSRELTPKDARGQIATATPLAIPREFRDRRALVILGAAVVLLSLLAWQRGYIDKVFAGDATELTVEMAGLEDCLALEVKSRWGNYEVLIQRGDAYPKTTEEGKTLLAQGKTPAELALLRAVVEGGHLFVRLEDEEGQVLEAAGVDLRALLSPEHPETQALLPGRMGAKTLRIALVSGKRR